MSNDACPECSYDDLASVIVHDDGSRAVCQACGWWGSRDVTETDDRGRDTERVTCDRCDKEVPLTQAMTHGPVEDPDEVVCEECIEPEDRVI